jgi:hypothetical protein
MSTEADIKVNTKLLTPEQINVDVTSTTVLLAVDCRSDCTQGNERLVECDIFYLLQ